MRATELRIGNLVIYHNDIIRVSLLVDDETSIVTEWNNIIDSSELKEYEPIPLTEEILIKAGFDRNRISFDFNEDCMFSCDMITLSYESGDVFILDQFSDENDDYHHNNSAKIARNIKFVHQLQNLYFVLTGEELIIEL